MEELVWKLEEAADRVEEWAFWTSLSVRENIENLWENLWDRVSEIPQALSDYFQDIGFHLEDLALSAESALQNLSTRLQEWWEEQKLHFQKTLESVGTQIKEVGTWLGENADKVALGIGVAGATLVVADGGAEKIYRDAQEFYQGAAVVVQVDLRGRIAEYLEDVRGIDDLASKIMGDIAQGRVPFSSQVDPNYGKRLDPKGGPEPW